jgi:hypothetical protein
MKIVGFGIYLTGIVIAAVFAAPKNPFWAMFAIGIALIIVGAIIIRRFEKPGSSKVQTISARAHRQSASAMFAKIHEANDRAHQVFAKYNQKANQVKLLEWQKEIEEILQTIVEVTSNKSIIQSELSTAQFANLYAQLAQGERNINRAWSSLIDGYLQESLNALKEAGNQFQLTRALCPKC